MVVSVIRKTTLIVLLCMVPALVLYAENTPGLNHGRKWRIGYYEGGPYSDYTETMRTLVNGLMDAGWIKKQETPALSGQMPKPYWDWLAQCDSLYLSFEAQDGYSANWNDRQRKEKRAKVLKKLTSGSLDLVIAMGTWAGQDLANNEHSVPVMVLSTSDPIGAGIIKSGDDSGYDHVTARVDPNRYLRQIRMFSRIVGFESLGIAYENTPDGRAYSAIKEARQVARERGFKLILCEVIDSTTDAEKSDQTCLDCYRLLARKSQAVYLTALTCMDRLGPVVAEIFRESRVPSFSMIGSRFVKEGMMLSISSDSGYAELGKFNAMKFGNILNGIKPRSLKQVFEDPLDIAVNMETVRQVEFKMPDSILKIATEIYEK